MPRCVFFPSLNIELTESVLRRYLTVSTNSHMEGTVCADRLELGRAKLFYRAASTQAHLLDDVFEFCALEGEELPLDVDVGEGCSPHYCLPHGSVLRLRSLRGIIYRLAKVRRRGHRCGWLHSSPMNPPHCRSRPNTKNSVLGIPAEMPNCGGRVNGEWERVITPSNRDH